MRGGERGKDGIAKWEREGDREKGRDRGEERDRG